MSEFSTGILQLRMGLLGEWFCAPMDATENDVTAFVAAHAGIPRVSSALIADRLYGGFRCNEQDRRHVYLAAGNYIYTTPEANLSATPEQRAAQWQLLFQENGIGGKDGFLADFV